MFRTFVNDCHVFAAKRVVEICPKKSRAVEFHVEIEDPDKDIIKEIEGFYNRFCACLKNNGSFKELSDDMEEFMNAAEEAWQEINNTPSR